MKSKIEIVQRGAGCTVRLRHPNGLHVSVHAPKGAPKKVLHDQAKVVKAAIFVMLPNEVDKAALREQFDRKTEAFLKRVSPVTKEVVE